MLNMTPTCGMPNPKKNHVRYARRIPAGLVPKMDEALAALMADSLISRRELEKAVIASEPLPQNVQLKRDYSKNYLK